MSPVLAPAAACGDGWQQLPLTSMQFLQLLLNSRAAAS